jgi:hypothetical protein
MRKVLFLAGLVLVLGSCGDDRSDTGGAGNTDTATTNTMVGTGNGSNTYGGGDTNTLNGTNSTNGINGGNTTGLDTSTKSGNTDGTGTQQRQ